MDPYRLFVYREDGQLIGPGIVIHAADGGRRDRYSKRSA
jgi:hypothetical protein